MKFIIATGIFPPDIGGPALYARRFAEEFSRKGMAVSVVTYGTAESKKEYRVISLSRRWPTGIRQFLYFMRLAYEAIGSDGIIAFDSLGAGMPAVFAGKLLRKKTILRLGGDFLWEKYIENGGASCTLEEFYAQGFNKKYGALIFFISYVLRNVDHVVFTTSFQQSLFMKYYGLTREKTSVLPNVFSKEAVSVKNTGAPGLLWAGRFLKLKNLPFLMEVYKYVQKHYKAPFTLTLIGDGPEKENIRKAIARQGLSDSIVLKDPMSQEQLRSEIGNAYCCVLPSLTEISPNFALECVSVGTPVVATSETGIRDLFPEFLYAHPKDVESFGGTVAKLIGDKDYYLAYAKRIAGISYEKTWAEAADEYLAFFKNK